MVVSGHKVAQWWCLGLAAQRHHFFVVLGDLGGGEFFGGWLAGDADDG